MTGSKRIRFACVREYVFPRKQSFCTLPSTGGCALGMASHHQQQLTLPLPQHRERLHSKRRKKVRHWRRKQRKMSENQIPTAINASDLSTSSDSDSGMIIIFRHNLFKHELELTFEFPHFLCSITYRL